MGGIPGLGEMGGGLGPQYIQITSEEKAAIERVIFNKFN